MDHDYAAVNDLMKRYYDGLYRCRKDILANVFHPQARYISASGDDVINLDLETYFSIIENRKSPESNKEPYAYDIESIEFAGPVTAFVRMRCFMLSKDYTDFLSVIWVDGKWGIISKVFHVQEQG